MSTKSLPKKIRVAGNVYELVQTEAPTAGGSNLKKMHRAVDDDDDWKDPELFSQVPADQRPTLDQIDSNMRVLTKSLETLREAFDSTRFDQWDPALDDFIKMLSQLKRSTGEEYRKLTGKHHWLL